MSARVVVSLDSAIVTEVELSKPVTVVGRHPACDIVIDHPAISGRHMLLRQVERTVYVEDLASTNGTKVNGIAVENQVVHHLDLIEVGKHKLHFFEDALLVKGVSNLENTVLTEFERTMIAAHVPEPAARPAPRRGPEDLSRTMVLQRDPAIRLGTAQEVVRTDQPASAPGLALRVVEGPRRGEVMPLDQANTMIGTAGGDTALVVKRGKSLFLARLSGNRAPRLNRKDLGPGTHPISAGDMIEVGGSVFEVVTAP
jgi:pSer/pThr/pTyr-binding forkhead associated (FHA) protein